MTDIKINTPVGGASYKGNAPFKDSIKFGAACLITFGAGYIFFLYSQKYNSKKKIDKYRAITGIKENLDNNHTENKIKVIETENKAKIDFDNAHTDNEIRVIKAKNVAKIDFDNAHTDNEIRVINAESAAKIKETESILEKKQAYNLQKIELRRSKSNLPEPQLSLREWNKEFHKRYGTPNYSGIPFLNEILNCCPQEYKDAMMFSLLPEFGAMVFSRVRAKFINGSMQSPNIMTVIEGVSGSGKSNFRDMHKLLFQHIIDAECKKLSNDEKGSIIQFIGINISASQFIEMLARNRGVHMYIMEQEIDTAKDAFKKDGWLASSTIRKAFDNDIEYQNKKGESAKGGFQVYLNATFAGTPGAINSLFKNKEKENGTARRFCFTVAPELGAKSPVFKWLAGEKLERIKKQIDEWRSLYCYHHAPMNGDVPCDEFTIDLNYINVALEKWCEQQYDRYKVDGIEERNNMRNGIAGIAFHCAIVLHMMAGNPSKKEKGKRNAVKNLTVYIANYCMERYLTKFSSSGGIRPQSSNDTFAGYEHPNAKSIRKMTLEEAKYWYSLRGTVDEQGKKIGLGYIARKLGTTKDEVRNTLNRYEKKRAS